MRRCFANFSSASRESEVSGGVGIERSSHKVPLAGFHWGSAKMFTQHLVVFTSDRLQAQYGNSFPVFKNLLHKELRGYLVYER
jgi:hypothetical protein